LSLPSPTYTGVLDWVLQMREQLGIAHTLAEIGIDDVRMEQVGKMAEVDPSAGTNPITFNSEQYRQIFENALTGKL
ncbi:MAG TPA: alcohol dehydrogenase, partial [Pseudomonas sp.]|nr:alcohol dehydrogenase [Pseudomonas sp.]